MIFASVLKVRDKIARKRNQLSIDEEKPFLAHLEDLRTMLFRIVLTLTVSMTLCFIFDETLFDIMERPLKAAGLSTVEEKNLPEGINADSWLLIHDAARAASILPQDLRGSWLETALPTEGQRPYAEALIICTAAAALPGEDARAAWLEKAAAALPEARRAPVLAAARGILSAGTTLSLAKLEPSVKPESLGVAETFMTSMKLSLFAGIIISFPLLFYFLLEFILPGLTEKERKVMWPALTVGFGLFITGVCFAYFFVTPQALEYFHSFSMERGIKDGWRLNMYVQFVSQFCLIFGVSFELPVVVMVLVKLGLLHSSTMRRTRAWAIIIIVTVSAILTPTGDMFTLSLLSGPMIIMYEICIWMAVAMEKKEARLEEEERQRDMARRAALVPVGVAAVQAARPTDGADGEEPSGPSWHDPYHDHNPPDHDPHTGLTDATPPDEAGDRDGPDGDLPAGNHHDTDPDKPDPEYELYMKEHAHLFPPAETHAEDVPVEERQEPAMPVDPAPQPPADPEEKPAPETPATPDSGEPAPPDGNGNPPPDPGTRDCGLPNSD